MKKFTVFALICVFALEACGAINIPNNPAPNVDTAGTVNAIAQTAFAQTLTAQPSPTAVPPTFTSTPTPVLAESSSTPTLVNTDTPVPNLTTSATATLALAVTATSGTSNVTATSTATLASNQPTASATLGIRTYGTLPPQNRPFTEITIVNRSRAEAYISLQVVTDQGYTIIEYPIERIVKVSIPTGNYTYVVWVGGRKFVGYFHASQFEEPSITIFRDKIVVN